MREAQEPGPPGRPPWRFAAYGVLAFAVGSLLAYFLFTMLLVLAYPTRNTPLAILAVFVLIFGTGSSSGLGLFVYHRLGRRWMEQTQRAGTGGVFTGDWRTRGTDPKG